MENSTWNMLRTKYPSFQYLHFSRLLNDFKNSTILPFWIPSISANQSFIGHKFKSRSTNQRCCWISLDYFDWLISCIVFCHPHFLPMVIIPFYLANKKSLNPRLYDPAMPSIIIKQLSSHRKEKTGVPALSDKSEREKHWAAAVRVHLRVGQHIWP